MTYGTARQATRAAKAAAVILTAVSCSVYDASLLGSGAAEGGNGGTNSAAGHSGSGGEGDVANGGKAGTGKGGSSGDSSGDAGMMDSAGVGGDGSDGGTSGSGGTAGSTGGGGTAGSSAGMATTGGDTTAGSGGTTSGGTTSGGSGGGSAGAGGAAVTGCAKLSVPIDASNDRAHFVISLASGADMSASTAAVSVRVYVQAGAAGSIISYVQNGSSNNYAFFGAGTLTALKSLSGWQTVTFPVGMQASSGSFSKTDVRRIGIEINATPDTTGWSNPTVVYVDSVTVTSPALSFTLDTMPTVNTTPTSTDPTNTAMWLNNGSTDTTASNVTLTWVQTCP